MERPEPDSGQGDLEKTARLLQLVKAGDALARERLVHRYIHVLERWASGRLPARARDLSETKDLVQVTFLRALDHMDGFEPTREGAFLAYLRRILMNLIRDEIRRTSRRPTREALTDDLSEDQPSPLEQVIGKEGLEVYEAALARLPEKQREAVIMRIEFGYTHAQVAEAMGSPSVGAARMLVVRGLLRLSKLMGRVKP